MSNNFYIEFKGPMYGKAEIPKHYKNPDIIYSSNNSDSNKCYMNNIQFKFINNSQLLRTRFETNEIYITNDNKPRKTSYSIITHTNITDININLSENILTVFGNINCTFYITPQSNYKLVLLNNYINQNLSK